MSPQYIPAGRTSVVKRGRAEFQLQTEYAEIPRPRVTTTIFTQGQVLHKMEKTIDRNITSIDEMHEVEDIIKAQHLEVSKIIRERGLPAAATKKAGVSLYRTRLERIGRLEAVERVFLVSGDRKISGDRVTTREFKGAFKHIVKALPDLISVFASLPGPGNRREEGVYEVEPGRILLVSTGVEIYLILVRLGTDYEAIAPQLKEILA